MKKKEFKKPEIKLVKMEQNISILAASGDEPTGYSQSLPSTPTVINTTLDR